MSSFVGVDRLGSGGGDVGGEGCGKHECRRGLEGGTRRTEVRKGGEDMPLGRDEDEDGGAEEREGPVMYTDAPQRQKQGAPRHLGTRRHPPFIAAITSPLPARRPHRRRSKQG